MCARRKRIVLKFGTGILTTRAGSALDKKQFYRLASEVTELVRDGNECIIVSSGAVGAGLHVLGLTERPADLSTVQACAAIGQSKLMRLYEQSFAAHRLDVAQLLLTHGDLDSRKRYMNAKNTLQRLLQAKKIVPIINENDSVAVEELKFGDNDRLSAEVAMLADADLLILLTSVEGLMHDGKRIRVITDVGGAVRYARPGKGRLSVGGMVSKLDAVKMAIHAGIQTVIANGRRSGLIARIVAGDEVGTRFVVSGKRIAPKDERTFSA
jgi:glutamate 5-kinase